MLDENRPTHEGPIRWNRLECERNPLNLSATLRSGQSFRWKQDTQGVWWGAVENTLLGLWQEEGQPDAPLFWQSWPEPDQFAIVQDYFRIGVDLDVLYAAWVQSEPRIGEAVAKYRGLRILRQPPMECFFAFQCATCNTVIKIGRSVSKLAERYGEPIEGPRRTASSFEAREKSRKSVEQAGMQPGGPIHDYGNRGGLQHRFYAFPTLEKLAEADEAALRSDLWGYRAPRVISLARHLLTLPDGWLNSLRTASYMEAKTALVAMHGIGEKLADCISLFGLDKDEATPVDTHVRQIAHRLFLPELTEKSLTPRVYDVIASAFRNRFGDYAGWAQQYLFLGELRHLK